MSSSPAASPLRIVAVHGVGNSFGPEVSGARLEELRTLKAHAWTRQLTSPLGVAPNRIDLDFAYYADKLTTGPVAHSAGNPDVLDDPLAQEILTAWARELKVPKEVSQGHATVSLRGLSSCLARRFDLAEGPLRVFIALLFREVATYMRSQDAPERVAAREEVARRIARHGPRIVIAHSLGSVVAYEALHAHPELQPELFLTLGSPLALRNAVFERLIPAPHGAGQARRGTRLPGKTRWVNIADPGDPVATPPQLGRFFDGIALDHTTVANPRFGFHHAENYLRSATTAATVAPYLDVSMSQQTARLRPSPRSPSAPVADMSAAGPSRRLRATQATLATLRSPMRSAAAPRRRPSPSPPEGIQSASELARQARAVLADAQRLARWTDTRARPIRSLTRGMLHDADVQSAAAELRMTEWQVCHAWDQARLAGLLELHGETARQGWLLRVWNRDDSAVLRGWVALFNAWSLAHPGIPSENVELTTVADVIEAVPQVLSLLRLSGGPVLVWALLDLLEQRVTELSEERFDATSTRQGAGSGDADTLPLLLDWALAGLASVGLLTYGDGQAALTPLGNWAVWAKLEQVVAAQSPAGGIEQSAEDMLRGCARLTPGQARAEYRTWLAARPVANAVNELLTAARGEDALMRGLVFEALRVVGAPAEAEVRAAATDSSLRPYALLWLAEYESADPEDAAEVLTREESTWLWVDTAAVVADHGESELLVRHLDSAVQGNDVPALLEEIRAVGHPRTVQVLVALAAAHPDLAVAKALRRAAFQVHTGTPTGHDEATSPTIINTGEATSRTISNTGNFRGVIQVQGSISMESRSLSPDSRDPAETEPPGSDPHGPPQRGGAGRGDGYCWEPRLLEAELVEQAPPRREVPLHVRVTQENGGSGVALHVFRIPAEGARLLITVHAPGLLALGDLQQELIVTSGRDSPWLQFGLRTMAPGLHTVTVRAFHKGTFLGELRTQVSVQSDTPARDGPPRRVPLTTLAFDPGEVTLQVLKGSDGAYSFQLLSETTYAPESFRLAAGDSHGARERIYDELRRTAATAGLDGGRDQHQARRRLINLGVQLWATAVPDAVRQQFWREAGRVTALTVVGEHDVVPWELLYPLDGQEEGDGFLAEWLPVVRRVFGQDRVRDLSLPRAAFVVPPGSPPEAEREVLALRARLGDAVSDGGTLTRGAAVSDLIDEGLTGLLHFACHNAFTGAGSHVTMADGPFDPIDLARATQSGALRTTHPLVFFNACRSAGQIDWFSTSLGWAPQFLRAGAGAFVGTLWPVRSDSALLFADTFYKHLVTERQSLGQASLNARRAIRDQGGDPTWLAYAIYGSPAARATP